MLIYDELAELVAHILGPETPMAHEPVRQLASELESAPIRAVVALQFRRRRLLLARFAALSASETLGCRRAR